MKKLFAALLVIFGTVIIAGQLPSASATTDSPVICEEHPSQPWLCAPLDGSYTDWNYMYGLNSPAADAFDQPATWDAYGEDSTTSGVNTATSGADVPSSRSGFATQYCRTSAWIRRVPAGGRYWTRGTGEGICRLNGVPVTRTWLITVCLLKSLNKLFGYQVVHCHSKSAVTSRIVHKVYHSCRNTTLTYWKAEVFTFSSQPYWTSTKGVAMSYPAIFPCG